MKGSSHNSVGVGFCITTTAVIIPIAPIEWVAAVCIGILIGSTAPDTMEIKLLGRYLVPHRTITHWLVPWLLSTVFSALDLVWWNYLPNIISVFALGFSIGGLLHLAGDLVTPLGIPIVSPFGRRFSLSLWKSGRGDYWFVGLAWLYATAAIVFAVKRG